MCHSSLFIHLFLSKCRFHSNVCSYRACMCAFVYVHECHCDCVSALHEDMFVCSCLRVYACMCACVELICALTGTKTVRELML